MVKRILLLAATALLFWQANAQQSIVDEFRTDPGKSGGVYYAYPGPGSAKLTAPPKGYKPFYISHYGRHGSRYMLSDMDYMKLLMPLQRADSANMLTPLGKEKLEQMKAIWEEAKGHTDELAPLGKRQHRGIAERMYKNYPQVFKKNAKISARSTTSLRCCLSMVAFVNHLEELDPSLDIDWDTSKSNMVYLNYHSKAFDEAKSGPDGWSKKTLGELNAQAKKAAPQIDPTRFANQIISDPAFFKGPFNTPQFLMQSFYDVASDLQDMEVGISFWDLFTPEELYNCWIGGNLWFYTGDANSPWNKGTAMASCQSLIDNIIEGADKAIAGEGEDATLRFGHDGNIIPLAARLHLNGFDVSEADGAKACEKWQNYKVSPMAANIQLIFFRKKGSDDILVKILLNENEATLPLKSDCAPYYNWKDVRALIIK